MAGLVGAGLAFTAPTATADPTKCDPGHTWSTVVNRSNYLQIDSEDMSEVHHNGTSQPMQITTNYSWDVGSRASNSTSTGKEVSAGVSAGWFNAAAGYQEQTVKAIEVTRNDSASVTTNITLEPGQRAIAYGGHRYAKGFVYHKRCSSDGDTVITDWSGWVKGPQYRERGWVLCSKTRYC